MNVNFPYLELHMNMVRFIFFLQLHDNYIKYCMQKYTVVPGASLFELTDDNGTRFRSNITSL